ncbi:MAG: tRNA uracil 4-sulfurtransferase ThiI [Thermodesulfobacteriota bacterium]
MPILIHYGELALKGKNRHLFENKLIENIKRVGPGRVIRLHGRIVVESEDIEPLKCIFGISWMANAYRAKKDLDSIKDTVLSKVVEKATPDIGTFGVVVNRADKGFPTSSLEVADVLGQEITNNLNLKVNLKKPDLPVYIEISDQVFVFFEKIEGLKGLPVGVSGRVLCLHSGGIDSPVAAYLMMKRGCEVDFIHFHSFNNAERAVSAKVGALVEKLGQYQSSSRLILVPYHPFHLSLLENRIDCSYELVLFRRFMLKMSELISKYEGYQALVTGDSLGQVASQTLGNLNVFNTAVSMPIFQPLISFDKEEIIELARKIETYDISIRPYKDCCSIMARRPRTRIKLNKVETLEKAMGLERVMEESLKLMETYRF